MRRWPLFLLFVGLVVPAFLGAVINPSREPWLKPGETLVCFGDSITAGDYYFKHLKASLEPCGIRVVNAGKSGDKTPTAFMRLSEVADQKPDAVMFFFGANDSAVGHGRWRDEPTVDAVTYRDNLLWMMQYLRTYSNVRKFSIVPPTGQIEGAQLEEFGDIRTAYCQAAREAADRANAVFVPLDVAFENARRTMPKDKDGLQLTRDGVHLSPTGSRLATEVILRAWNMSGKDVTPPKKPVPQNIQCPWIGFVPVEVLCADPAEWTLRVEALETPDGTAGLKIVGRADKICPLPAVSVRWRMPQVDAPFRWRTAGSNKHAPEYTRQLTDLLLWMPLDCVYSCSGQNRMTWGVRETRRPVRMRCGVHEEACEVEGLFELNVGESIARTNEFAFEVCLDPRQIPYYEAVSQMAAWMRDDPRLGRPHVPESAFDPLYSAWYSFHQDVNAEKLEGECRIASRLGMKTLIVDDGWQATDVRRDFSSCGDWVPAFNKFPDMRAHVERIHGMGMKYLPWIGIGFFGNRSEAFHKMARYTYRRPERPETIVPDLRFKEVRTYLADACERLVCECGVDGFKIDFIDYFGKGPKCYPGDGRDIADESEAVERLLQEIRARVKGLRPDLLIEYREPYIAPAIGQYANMFRVSDCPGDADANRFGIAKLRLVAGPTAVHSDMLQWHPNASPEEAAGHVLSAIFGVVQYSVRLSELPESHLRMLEHWIGFSNAHRQTLLRGTFRPLYPERNYPLICAETPVERIWGIYDAGFVCPAGALDRPVLLLNGTGTSALVVDLPSAPAEAIARNCFGEIVGHPSVGKGLSRPTVPPGGYLELKP